MVLDFQDVRLATTLAESASLTAAGSRFVEMAGRLLAVEQEIEQHFAGERHERRNMLRIAGNTSYVTDILPSIAPSCIGGMPMPLSPSAGLSMTGEPMSFAAVREFVQVLLP